MAQKPPATLPDERKSVDEDVLDHEEGLYRHKKRPQWGVAILAWEKGDRRAYQFEDGRLRKFKEGYYSLMVPAGEVERKRENVINDLEEAIEQYRARDEEPTVLEPVATFQEQIDLFLEMYPNGFQDDEWISEHRGEGPGRALKRHRDPAAEETQETLSKAACEEWIGNDEHGELVDAALEILAGTDLVALKHVKALRGLEPEEKHDFAEAIYTVLHGEGDFNRRLKKFFDVMTELYGGRPSWRIATALQALMYPENHVCVRYSAFIRQAAVISPVAKYTRKAKVRSYKNFRRVAFAVKRKLEAEGHKPKDLLDIYDFIWHTLRNAALDHLGDEDDDE